MTSLEYLKALDENDGTSWTEDDEAICQALDQFAQLKNAEYIEALREAKELKQAVESLLYWMDHYCPPSMTTQKQAFERVKALLK